MTTPTPPVGTPTQLAHPWRAVLRIFVAAAVAVLVRWLAARGLDLTALSEAMVDSIVNALAALVLGFVQWLLTRQWVENWLRRYAPIFASGVHTGARHRAED